MTFTRRTFMETTCALSAGLVFGSVAHASTKVPENGTKPAVFSLSVQALPAWALPLKATISI